MEKVVLTPEQAEALEKFNRAWEAYKNVAHGLHGLSFDTILNALQNGYEIEEFKVGDWITWIDKHTGKVLEVFDDDVLTDIKGPLYGANQRFLKKSIRKATDEEIAAEKERRKWAAIGRKPGEFKKGDIVRFNVLRDKQTIEEIECIVTLGDNVTCCQFIGDYGAYPISELKLICPVEQRFDLKVDE